MIDNTIAMNSLGSVRPPSSSTRSSPTRNSRSRSPESSSAHWAPFLASSSLSSSSAAADSVTMKPSSSMMGSPKRRVSRSSFSNQKSHRYTFITKCLLSLFAITLVTCTVLWEIMPDSSKLLEDQICSVKEWQYPTCIPRAGEILTHIPTPEDYSQMRQAYHRAVLEQERFALEPTQWINGSATGFTAPVRVQYSETSGRGLYAAAFIPKGTKIWDSRYSARIQTECEGKRFIEGLTNDQACNVIMWGYVADLGSGKLDWSIDLDPCSFTNEANTAEEVNVVDRIVDPSKALEPDGHSMWASKDIEEGTEILSSYEGIRTFNPMKNLYWQLKGVFTAWGWGPFLF